MLSKLTVLNTLLISATLISCGGGIGKKSTIGLNNTNTNQSASANSSQSASINNNQSNSENTSLLESDSESTTESILESESNSTSNKTFPASVACAGSTADIQNNMLYLINAARAQARMCGATLYPAAPALVWNSKLETAALNHSTDMSANNFFSHTGSDGLSVSDRAEAAQYNWRAIGENIAAGQPTSDIAVSEWLESPGHCANIMSDSFEELAVACVYDSGAQYRHYWTQVFGTRF